MAKSTKKTVSPLLAVFITVFIDMLGIGIIIPITPNLFLNPAQSILPPDFSEHSRNILYGFFAATYPFFQFFGAPILGTLADRFGRKKILQISLVGTFIGYVLFAGAINSKLLWLLFLARALPGFTGGNISIALAALADVSKPDEKAKNFGIVGMAFGLGFILGPTLGGILSSPSIVSWFSPATPLYFTAIITVINMIYVYKQFPETFTPVATKGLSIFTGINNLKKAIRMENMRVILLVIFFQAFGWSFFMQFNQVYLIHKFHFTNAEIGILFGYIGIWIAITQGGITRQIAKYFIPSQVLRVALFGLAIAILAVLLPDKPWLLYLCNPFIAIFQGLAQPNQTSIVSSLASKDSQGEMLGIQQSMQSFAFTIPPIMAGFMLNFDVRLPMVVAAFMTLMAWGVFFFFFKTEAAPEVSATLAE